MLAAAVTPKATPTPAPTPALRAGLSWDQADSLRRKILDLEQSARAASAARPPRPARPRTVTVTQGELNSYLNLMLRPRFPAGLHDVDFTIEDDRLSVRAAVDLDKVKEALNANSIFNPLSILTGTMPIEAKGKLKNKEDGFGAFEIEDVRLGPMMLPPPLLQQLVATSTRTRQNPQGFDIQAPFRYPYGLRRVRLQKGKALLDL